MKKSRFYNYTAILLLLLSSCARNTQQKTDASNLVKTTEEFNQAITAAKLGDTFILQNGSKIYSYRQRRQNCKRRYSKTFRS